MPFFLFSLLIFSSTCIAESWTGINECGTYQIRGVVRSTKKDLHIVANEKTMSQIIINVPTLNEAFLAPYLDKSIEATVLFQAKNTTEGTVKEIKMRIPNPLNPMDAGVKFLAKEKCL